MYVDVWNFYFNAAFQVMTLELANNLAYKKLRGP
jgi:hypothetical protein